MLHSGKFFALKMALILIAKLVSVGWSFQLNDQNMHACPFLAFWGHALLVTFLCSPDRAFC